MRYIGRLVLNGLFLECSSALLNFFWFNQVERKNKWDLEDLKTQTWSNHLRKSVTTTSHVGDLDWVLAPWVQIPCLCNVPRKREEDGPSPWVPAAHVTPLDRASGSSAQPSPSIAGIWRLNQWKYLSFPLFFFFSPCLLSLSPSLVTFLSFFHKKREIKRNIKKYKILVQAHL